MGAVSCKVPHGNGQMFPFCLSSGSAHVTAHLGFQWAEQDQPHRPFHDAGQDPNEHLAWDKDWNPTERVEDDEIYVHRQFYNSQLHDATNWWHLTDTDENDPPLETCKTCGARFWSQHLYQDHIEAGCVSYTCRCGEGFATASELESHKGRLGHNVQLPPGTMTKSARKT